MNCNSNSREKESQAANSSQPQPKSPRSIFPHVFAFPPNRETLGGTSYLLIHQQGNILIDAPAWHELNYRFCQQQGGVKYLFFTHRDGISKQVKQLKRELNCELIIQEQEAYLLPNLDLTTFASEYSLNDTCTLLWTAGYSPGSACLYDSRNQGTLFSGRHLLPTNEQPITPLRGKKTFHWWRQLNNVRKLCDRFSADNLNYICPASNTGYLRGKGYVNHAYQQLQKLDLAQLKYQSSPL
jgi:hypothetical protein